MMFPKMEADVNSKQDVYVNIDTHTHTTTALWGLSTSTQIFIVETEITIRDNSWVS